MARVANMGKEPHALRIAFLFTSSREGLLEAVRSGKEPDTALRGLNYLPYADAVNMDEARYWFFLLPRLMRYDVVIASDALPLGFFVSVASRIRRRKTRFVYLAITTSTLLRRHARHPFKRFVLKRFWKSYWRIICISSAQKRDLEQFGMLPEQLELIPFSIDAAYYGATSGGREERFILSVGRDAGRAYATLLETAQRLKYPFVIVASQKVLPPGTPLPANVSVRYNLAAEEIRALYAQARMVVVVSKPESEPVGSDCSGQTVVLEALAAKKAVVVTERTWITDYLVPAEDLSVVSPNSPVMLAAAIQQLWQDGGRRGRLAASGQTKVRALYTIEAFARSLEKLFSQIRE
ncbi:MAG: glycosyltransferase family 4 protein [Minisyncoccia bacterium]